MKIAKISLSKAELLVIDDINWDGCVETFVGINYPGFILVGPICKMLDFIWRGIVDPLFTDTEINADGRYHFELDLKPMPFKNYIWEKTGEGFSSCKTASESGISLLTAHGVVFENSLGKDPLYYTDKFSGDNKVRLDWLKAQEKIWSENTQFFIKPKELSINPNK